MSEPACSHLATIAAVRPSAHGCEACLETGKSWKWCRIDEIAWV